MRDQFACGIRDDSTRFELFKDKTITFEKALEEALAREEATKNAAGAAPSSTSHAYKQENFALDERRTESKRRAKQRPYEDRQQSAERQCFCCGKKGHATKDCKYRDRKCDFCHKKGHLERACIKKKNLSNKFLEHNSSASDSEPADSESECGSVRSTNYIDFHNICTAKSRNDCYSISAEPVYFDVNINDKIITMEFDSGTYYSVMSEKFVKKHFPTEKISKVEIHLISYENSAMEPRGQLKNLLVKLNNETKILKCLILKGDKVPLIGRQWLAAFDL
ncbi:hypothetical protein TKK_0013286 [Trichogramma kaykai]|uniref:CCHC-type domain-containing protein n=1 Tax=Trichogramma kaykai TaxID=54128 RepID=A0ABD2WJJ1_9HYME